ncbi:hypothetical protein FISHEDRAFT_67293 [Fistulina hepatica ATCC 64428]|uniref:Zinc finger Mcm10/DnaG-type domain-containing protein n=1 Tax=Fistulina hepatica ATCC 64428 TaxID=1128425 RepID=A0A0D7A270_9AGAR|nr:hypothetical protein FISHEDRAFT_67293 [Fistulina hepatica ATCC 64428]
MESSSSRTIDDATRAARLQAQIHQLQSELENIDRRVVTHPPALEAGKKHEGALLAPATPSPSTKEKKRKAYEVFGDAVPSQTSTCKKQASSKSKSPPVTAGPSTLFSRLAAAKVSLTSPDEETEMEPAKSSSFTAKAAPLNQRDDRLALVHEFVLGPADHKPPFDDPHFDYLEPNSGIRLSSRIVPNDDLQAHLEGRYFVSPSRLYATVRLLPNKQAYEVPVPGDWVTIAVVAERGPIKCTRAPIGPGRGDEDAKPRRPGQQQQQQQPKKEHGKKYVNLKLVDFGARSASSANGGRDAIRGDACLSLLLFEADSFDTEADESGTRQRKVYRGGSRGAFEAMSKVREGDVIALLNPRILRPFQQSSEKPHPRDNILALTPESAESIMVIGRARDLGMCVVEKRDGAVCGAWFDKRTSDVCDYHVQTAVQRRRAARPEFSAGTSGMGRTAAVKRKPAYDPARQWGLQPRDEPTGATYVVSGHVVGGMNTLHVQEKVGREAQARAQRKASSREAEKALQALLAKDKEGTKAVMAAQRAIDTMHAKAVSARSKGEKTQQMSGKLAAVGSAENSAPTPPPRKQAYSAAMIKKLGFNPSLNGVARKEDGATQNKLNDLVAAQKSRTRIALGPRPGPKIRSGVRPPPTSNDDDASDNDLEGNDDTELVVLDSDI